MTDCWETYRLADLVDIHHGYAFKGDHINSEGEGDVLLTPGNFLTGGGFKGDKYKYFSGFTPDEYVLGEGDILVTMTDLSRSADTLGVAAKVPAMVNGKRFLHNQRLGLVQVRDCKADPGFIYYFLRSPRYRNFVLASATGTTVRHTSPTRIGEVEILLPSLAEQQRISGILDVLENKIENNRKLARTLEETAATLFRARFVDFVDHDDLVESEIGPIPAGWTVAPFSTAFEVNPRVAIRKGRDTPFVAMSDVGAWGVRPHEISRREYSGGVKFELGDTLMAKITGCIEHGKGAFVDFVDEPSAGSTEFHVFRAKSPFSPECAFLLSRLPEFREHSMVNMTGSSGRQRVPSVAFDNFSIAVPPDQAAIQGELDCFRNCFALSRSLWQESRTLTKIRDTLLPKLISGEIRVPEAEEVVKEAV